MSKPVVLYEEPNNPCVPSPCGSYSICREINTRPVCSCQANYFGAPPNCRPECVVSSECSHDRSCVNQRCVDPCPGTCGYNAQCRVTHHNPICSCNPGFIGDPFVQCIREQSKSDSLTSTDPNSIIQSKLYRETHHRSRWKSVCSVPLWTEFRVSTQEHRSCLLLCFRLYWTSAQLSSTMYYQFRVSSQFGLYKWEVQKPVHWFVRTLCWMSCCISFSEMLLS